jgi:hypothetical protein
MGVLKFRFLPLDFPTRLPSLRAAYFTGLDRTPDRTSVEIRAGLMRCARENPESGRLNVSFPVEGHGAPMLATATLADRVEPFDLAVELARGRLNDVRNQAAEWTQLGLPVPPIFEASLRRASREFARAATSRHDPELAAVAAGRALTAACDAADHLVAAYTETVLTRRLENETRLPTLLAVGLDGGDPRKNDGLAAIAPAFNAARVRCAWNQLAPTEGRLRWDEIDDQLAYCKAAKLQPILGPLIELRSGTLPDWLWLWGGNFEQVMGLVEDLVKQVVTRYRGKVPVWHLVHRAGSGEVLGLTEEEQIRLAARALQIARRLDQTTEFVIDFDRPWGAWMASSNFQIGPLHLADSLARADLGLSGVGLEFALGYSTPGSYLRDLFEFSRILDLYSLVDLPIHVSLALPAGAGTDPKADPAVSVLNPQWPSPPDDALQRDWASRFLALAVAKPFVRSVTWLQADDAAPHLYPHAGLIRPDRAVRPLAGWMKDFRKKHLS